MGKQYNKVIKRTRRKDYLKRRAEQEKVQMAGAKPKPKAKKSADEPAKKKAPKKKIAKKKAPKAEVETPEIPGLEESAAPEVTETVAEPETAAEEPSPSESTGEEEVAEASEESGKE